MLQKWQIISQQDVSPSMWFPIVKDEVKLPSGKVIEYFKARLQHVVMVLPVTVENEIVFVRQYKHGIGEICVELPAGRIEAGQTPSQAAIAELRQETGISVTEADLQPIIELWTEPSKSSVRVSGFLVQNVRVTELQTLDETEAIEIVKVPLKQLNSYLLAGNVHGSDTLALIQSAQLKFPELFV